MKQINMTNGYITNVKNFSTVKLDNSLIKKTKTIKTLEVY